MQNLKIKMKNYAIPANRNGFIILTFYIVAFHFYF